MLPEIVKAVNGRAEIYVDGGIMNGTDVFKCIALGATAVVFVSIYPFRFLLDGRYSGGLLYRMFDC